MTEAINLRGRRICIIHPYPSVGVLARLAAEGARVVAVGGAAPEQYCEARLRVPLHDHDAICAAIARHHASSPIDVMLPLYEGSTALTARVARELGLRGSPVAAAEASRNKYRTFEVLSGAGLPVPHTVAVRGEEDVPRIGRDIGYPAVIKLADSMNSQGVTRVDDADDCLRELRKLLQLVERPTDFDASVDRNRVAYGRGDVRLIAQPFCPGREVNVDLLFNESAISVTAVFEKADSPGPYFPEHMSVCPTSLDDAEERAVAQLAMDAVRALGLEIGAAHVEIRFSGRTPMVLEAGARPGGGLTIDAIEALTGIHSVVELAKILLGGRVPAVQREPDRAVLYGGKVYTSSGTLSRIRGVDEATQLPGVTRFFQLHEEGDVVCTMPESAQPHFCYYLLERDSRDAVMALHERIRQTIQLDVTSAP